MAIRSQVPLQLDSGVTRCPTCGYPVRIIYRDGTHADHYEPIIDHSLHKTLMPADEETLEKLRKLREGKKTVALVGMAPTSCSLAPFNDQTAEVWGLNEAHAFEWMKSWDRWFQPHKPKDFTRDLDAHRVHERGYVKGHFDWLKQKHGKPIYMQYKYDYIPDSMEYPLVEVVERFFGKIRKGDEKVKYFTSTFAYMLALALYEDFERIEIFGFEMSGNDEYAPQKAGSEFWIGMAMGLGKELHLPPKSQLIWGPLYGYQGSSAANVYEGEEYDDD